MKNLRLFLFICVFLAQIFLFAPPVAAAGGAMQILRLYINDGSGGVFTQQTTNMGEFIIPREIPKRDGYIFSGWARQPNAALAEYQPMDYIRTGDELIELYAVWQLDFDGFVLIYNANGGSDPPDRQTAAGGGIFQLFVISEQQPQRAGYIFLGWSLDPDAFAAEYSPGDVFATLTRQTVLYAVWQEQRPIIYYLAYDGGDESSEVPGLQTIEAPPGGCIFQISEQIPRRPGYVFCGWSATPGAASADYQPGDIFNAAATFNMLYALWQPQLTYRLYFDPNDNNDSSNMPATQTGQTTDTYYTFQIPAQIPIRQGWDFLGWSQFPDANTADVLPNSEFTVITQQSTLYAVWQEKSLPPPQELTYTLVYHANGGDGAPQTQAALSTLPEHTFQISDQRPTRDGYDFIGWNTYPDAPFAAYQPGDKLTTDTADNILYAVWRRRPQPEPEDQLYQVFFNANGGQTAVPFQTAYGTSANCLLTLTQEIPQRDGYEFSGWAFEPTAAAPNCFPGEIIIINQPILQLYAVWQRREPPLPEPAYLQQLLGDNAVTLQCINPLSGHQPVSFPLLAASYTCQLEQIDGQYTAKLNIEPTLYLQAYNSQTTGHWLAAAHRYQQIRLVYAEEKAAWLLPANYQPPVFSVCCFTPAQPSASDIPQILNTPFLVTVECVDFDNCEQEHFAVSYGLLPEGLQIGPVQTDEHQPNTYICCLTFPAAPYLAAYKISYGSHQLAPSAVSEQTIILRFDPDTQTWRPDSSNLPYFPVVYAEEPDPGPIFQYSLNFDANGGFAAPYPQSAATFDEHFIFIIPQEQPRRANYQFLGWADRANADEPAYYPRDFVILHRELPALTLYAVWRELPETEKTPEDEPITPPERPEIAYCLYYDPNGGDDAPAEQVCYSSAASCTFEITAEQPKLDGYILAGWALNPTAEQADYQAGDLFCLEYDQPIQTLYAVWATKPPETAPLPGYGGGSAKPNTAIEPDEPPPDPVPVYLHTAYIYGYPDGTIRPQSGITRAEIATIICRLLPTENTNETVYAIANDVQPPAWYYNAMANLQQNGLLLGYTDGSLRPNQILTHAELVTLLIRLNKLLNQTSMPPFPTSENYFDDIAGHWAELEINQAAACGWLRIYSNGRFAPDQPVSRAETISILNNLLNRRFNPENLAPDNIWPDNPPGAWFYADMQEAGNSHAYRIENDTEIWQEIIPE